MLYTSDLMSEAGMIRVWVDTTLSTMSAMRYRLSDAAPMRTEEIAPERFHNFFHDPFNLELNVLYVCKVPALSDEDVAEKLNVLMKDHHFQSAD
jgi:hypothetical protein